MAAIAVFLQHINWVDIAIIILILRGIQIGAKRGFFIEIFKIISILCAIYISIHYFSVVSDYVNSNAPVPVDFADSLSFAFLIFACILIWVPIRDGILHFVKVEAVPVLNKFGGAMIGLLRSFLVVSLFVLILEFMSGGYFGAIVVNSKFGTKFSKLAPSIYVSIHDNLIAKFAPDDKLNNAVFEVINEVEK